MGQNANSVKNRVSNILSEEIHSFYGKVFLHCYICLHFPIQFAKRRKQNLYLNKTKNTQQYCAKRVWVSKK